MKRLVKCNLSKVALYFNRVRNSLIKPGLRAQGVGGGLDCCTETLILRY